MTEDLIFAAQVRAARGLLGWSQLDLAEKAKISRTVVARVEQGVTDARSSTVRMIQAALAKAGVSLFNEAEGAFGVRFMAKPAMGRGG